MPPRQQAQQGGIVPPGPPPLLMGAWDGIDTSTTRPGIADEKMFWCDGFFPFGSGGLRTLPDVGSVLYDLGSPNFYKLFCSSTSVYGFATGGTIIRVNLTSFFSSVVTNTFPGLSAITVGACQLLPGVIAFVTSDAPDGLFIYSEASSTIYAPGQVVPDLDGFTIPNAIAGTTCATYSGRLWIGEGNFLRASAPDSLIDFTIANGAVGTLNTDSFLATRYVALISSGGFLYLVGDSSVSYISGVTVNTNLGVTTTTYTMQNADPEVGGALSPGAVISIGRSIGVSNPSGYYLGTGGSFVKMSQPLDGVYSSLDNTQGVTAARADIFGRRALVVLEAITDPISKTTVNKFFLHDGKRWFSSAQSVNIQFITTWENFGKCFAVGCDLQRIYFCFHTQSNAFTKLVQSKLWVTPEGYHTVKTTGRFWAIARYQNVTSPDLTVKIENETADNTVPSVATYTITGPVATGFFVVPPEAIGQMGVMLGMTISTTCQDMTLISAMIQPEVISYRG